MSASASPVRYASVAIVLHWAIALMILTLIPVGWTIGDQLHAIETHAPGAPPAEQVFALVQMHKTFGILVLTLTIARIAWRLMNPPPALPDMPAHERVLAGAVHWGFYALMILLPLSGWALASASPTEVPTRLFNALPWPHLPVLGGLELEAKQALAPQIENVHGKLAWVAIALVVLHVAGALKHQLLDRTPMLQRIGLGRAPAADPKPRGALIAFGLAAVFVIGGAAAAMLTASGQGGALVATAPARAEAWIVDAEASSIGFEVQYHNKPVAGGFDVWLADIVFDPADLDGSSAIVTVDAASITIADGYLAGQAKGSDGFDVEDHPEARFEANAFRALGGDRYEADGVLTIRDASAPLTLPFTLTIADGRARAEGEASLQRLDFGLGQVNDASGGWLGKTVVVRIVVEATRPE